VVGGGGAWSEEVRGVEGSEVRHGPGVLREYFIGAERRGAAGWW
jgi:hypothetical protein